MKSLRRLILIFAAGLALPLGYLVVQAYRSLDAEEAATFGFFAEALFDAMQASAAELVRREEARPVDAYAGPAASALFGLPAEDYIRGYFQNDPDGGFQTPHRSSGPAALRAPASRLAELEEANRVFNRKRADGTDRVRAETAETERSPRSRRSTCPGLRKSRHLLHRHPLQAHPHESAARRRLRRPSRRSWRSLLQLPIASRRSVPPVRMRSCRRRWPRFNRFGSTPRACSSSAGF